MTNRLSPEEDAGHSMTKRKAETPRLMWEIILRQMAAGHVVHVGTTKDGKRSYRLACPKCGLAIDLMDKRQREHNTPIALGGKDDPTNQQYWHDRCSKIKTNGKPHDVSNGDLHKIAKAKRIAAREAHQESEAKAQKHKPKMQSRGFDKTLRKKFNGQVEKRT